MMHLLKLRNVSILHQLQIEEALLRADARDWCLINVGAPDAIVMGISGKPEELVHLQHVQKENIPLIKRFSGGGTVYIDRHTVFVTFICNHERCSPKTREIMQWSEQIYRPFFGQDFKLIENDYVFDQQKFGGNAQYVRKERWLHHTSFLWDFDPKKMESLKLPPKRPQYRHDRSHQEFLCSLRARFPCKETFIEDLSEHLKERLNAQEVREEILLEILERPHRKATIVIETSLS